MTTAERAKTLRKPPVYLLGAGVSQGYDNSLVQPDMTVTPAVLLGAEGVRDGRLRAEGHAVRRVLRLLHDPACRCCLEDAGLIPKGEVGPFFESHRHDVQGHVPDQHGRRPALSGPAQRHRRRAGASSWWRRCARSAARRASARSRGTTWASPT